MDSTILKTSEENLNITSVEYDLNSTRKYIYGKDLNYRWIEGPGKREIINERHRNLLEKAKIDISNETKLNNAINLMYAWLSHKLL